MKQFFAVKMLFVLVLALGAHTVDVPQAHAELFRRPLFFRPFFNRRFVPVNRGGNACNGCRVIRNNNIVQNRFVDARNTTRIPGFARLLKNGKDLVEQDRFGGINRIYINRNGDLRGARDPETLAHLREFYQQNFDQFRGRARDTVIRFLQRNATNTGIFGQLTAAIRDQGAQSMGVVPEGDDYAGYTPEQKRTAAMAWVLNSISNSCSPIPIFPQNVRADGTIGLNLNGFINSTRLAGLMNDNPYACGNPRAPIRPDWFTANALTPERYYAATGLDDDLNGLGRQLGVKVDQRNINDFTGRKIDRILVKGNVDKPQSGVGVNPQRVLEVQDRANSFGESFYRSYDFIENPTSGVNSNSRDVLKEGINFTSDADEIIFTKCNKFLGFYLSNAAGQRQREAPASIAIDSGKSVVAPDRCMKCHANGFLGGDKQNFGKGEDYTDMLGQIAQLDRQTGFRHSVFFSTNEAYKKRQKADSEAFMQAKIATGAHLPKRSDPSLSNAIAHDMSEAYWKPLPLDQAARELGVPPSAQLAQLLRTTEKKDPKTASNEGGATPQLNDDTIDRRDFERKFCFVRAQLGFGGAVNGFDQFQPNVNGAGFNHNGGFGNGQGQGQGVIRRRYE